MFSRVIRGLFLTDSSETLYVLVSILFLKPHSPFSLVPAIVALFPQDLPIFAIGKLHQKLPPEPPLY